MSIVKLVNLLLAIFFVFIENVKHKIELTL